MSTTDKYRAEEPRYLWYCGTKKHRKGDGTGTVEKWYRGAEVVLWYRATLYCSAGVASESAAAVWLTESCITTHESCVVRHGFCQSPAYSLQRQCIAREYVSLRFISLWVCALATRSSQRVAFPSLGCGMFAWLTTVIATRLSRLDDVHCRARH